MAQGYAVGTHAGLGTRDPRETQVQDLGQTYPRQPREREVQGTGEAQSLEELLDHLMPGSGLTREGLELEGIEEEVLAMLELVLMGRGEGC